MIPIRHCELQEIAMENQPRVDNRANTEVEVAIREARMAVGPDNFHTTLNTLSHRGVPRVVIERIFIYRQRCRAADHKSE